MQYGPKGTPVHRQKGQKDRISPKKRSQVHMELLSILCGVNRKSISKYFSNENLELSNPRAVRKRLLDRLAKRGGFERKDVKSKKKYKGEKLPIQGPSYPNNYKPKK